MQKLRLPPSMHEEGANQFSVIDFDSFTDLIRNQRIWLSYQSDPRQQPHS